MQSNELSLILIILLRYTDFFLMFRSQTTHGTNFYFSNPSFILSSLSISPTVDIHYCSASYQRCIYKDNVHLPFTSKRNILVWYQVSTVCRIWVPVYYIVMWNKQVQCFLGSEDEDHISFSASTWMSVFWGFIHVSIKIGF